VLPSLEFDFKQGAGAQQLKIQRLQGLFVVPIAGFVLLLSEDSVYCALLELTLLLVFLRARQGVASAAVVEGLVIKPKSTEALIHGRQCLLSACAIEYSCSWLTVFRMTTAQQSYRSWISPSLLGDEKYRQLIALLKAKPLLITPSTVTG